MRILKKITDEFWWDVARTCEYATFYHTPLWRELAVRVSPEIYRDETFGAILPSGVRAVFPLVSTRRLGPLRWIESTYAGCYGGLIADGPIHSSEAAQLYKQACAWSTSAFYMLDNPMEPPLPDEVKRQLKHVVSDVAHELTLDADFDTIFSHFSRSQRHAYRNGVKKGVRIREATSLDDYRAYFTNYRDAVERWGEDESYGYSWHLFEQLYDLSRSHPENIKLWLMIVDEQIVGGRIVFYWGRQATGWNGTAHRDFLNYNVMPVADTEIIRDAINRGYKVFDFNTSNGNQGVVAYKERFSPVAVPLNGWFYENPLISSARVVSRGARDRVAALRRPGAQAEPVGQSSPTQQNTPEPNA